MFNFNLKCVHVPGRDNLSRLTETSHLMYTYSLVSCGQLLSEILFYKMFETHVTCKHKSYFFTGSGLAVWERQLDNAIMFYLSCCFAEITKSAYKSYVQSYVTFCNNHGYMAYPANNMTLSRHVVYLSDKLSVQSIRKYLSAIRLIHMEMGLPNPLVDNWAINSLLIDMQRCRRATLDRKLPITPDILLGIHRLLDIRCDVGLVVYDFTIFTIVVTEKWPNIGGGLWLLVSLIRDLVWASTDITLEARFIHY